jgi:AcrR family transcriptional regulator
MKAQPLRVTLREATRSAIVDAAEKVAARDGLSGASLQAIAEQAGVAVGTIYNYFEDRDRLFDALFTRRRDELFEAIDAAAKEHRSEPFQAQLDAFVRAVLGFFDGRRDYLRVAFDAESARFKRSDAKKGSAVQQLRDRAERVVKIGLREKVLREEDADIAGDILVGIVRGILMAGAQTDRTCLPDAARVTALFLRGAGK